MTHNTMNTAVIDRNQSLRYQKLSKPELRNRVLLVLFVLATVATVLFIRPLDISSILSGFADSETVVWPGVQQQRIEQRMLARNGKNWNAGFTLSADDTAVHVKLDIKLIPQDGIRAPALDKRKQQWLQGIEKTWNNNFYLQLPDQRLLPVEFDVNFKSVNAHHEVIVRKGSHDSNHHNWYMNTGNNVIAHEIGHMLGAYDEYRNGAMSPEPVLIRDTSLMSKQAGNGQVHVRHLHLLQEKLVAITGIDSLVIVQAGEQAGLKQ